LRFILASSSPRRRELLHSIGLDFDVVVSHVEEVRAGHERVDSYVLRLAREKAAEVARRYEDRWVIAADTVVYLDGEVLEKPHDDAHAIRMLKTIAGREHIVYTGVTLQCVERGYTDSVVVASSVRMSPMSDAEIERYVSTGEPLDKAGAYAIQGLGAMLVASVNGNYTNVVGLPLEPLYQMLKRAGFDPLTLARSEGEP
jgi:septum formation protein